MIVSLKNMDKQTMGEGDVNTCTQSKNQINHMNDQRLSLGILTTGCENTIFQSSIKTIRIMILMIGGCR